MLAQPTECLRRGEMIYKFKSKASGDVIMLGPVGERVLSLIGKEPAAQGIILPAVMPAAIAALLEAVHQDEVLRASLARQEQALLTTGTPQPNPGAISLRQRAWPMVDMMQRCHAANEPIVWGV